MRFFSLLAGLSAGLVLAAPQSSIGSRADLNDPHFRLGQSAGHSQSTVAHPGSVDNIIITKENTLNGTGRFPNDRIVQAGVASTTLPLSFVNNYKGGGGQVYAYIQGKDTSGRAVFVRGDGSLLYPSSGGSQVPVPVDPSVGIPISRTGGTFNMTIPISVISGRIYLCEGNLRFYVVSTPDGDGIVQPSVANLADPSAGLMWGFMEFTFNPDGTVYSNISYVDFVGLALSLAILPSDGTPLRMTRGLGGDALQQICNELIAQAGIDGYPWNFMCITSNGKLMRVLSPNSYDSIKSAAFADYFSDYTNKVWGRFDTQPLNISTQRSDIPFSQCTVSGDLLHCSDDNRPYQKPNATDIFGCNTGPFAIQKNDSPVHVANVPRICAAIHRSTFLLEDGNVQPGPDPSEYYKAERTNHYSRVVHKYEVDGRGYAFAYDDVNPSGHDDASGSIACQSPRLMTVFVGGSG